MSGQDWPESASAQRDVAWLSRGFEALEEAALRDKREGQFDVVVVGSGYGGSIAASFLAGLEGDHGRLRVCVLERGSEYLRGMFPSSMADLAGHVRFATGNSSKPRGRLDGLFDVRVGDDLNALVANGLGGGSLINAGVMAEADAAVFDDRWPLSLRGGQALSPYYQRARTLLGTSGSEGEHHFRGLPSREKGEALQRVAGGRRCVDAAVTIASETKRNPQGVLRTACIGCGDCVTGCNFDAKNSLDVSLLVTARKRGAQIYSGATVLTVERHGHAGWALRVVHTDDKPRQRMEEPLIVRASHLVLAAGTFGSTEILMRSQDERLALSEKLGSRLSANGDGIAVAYALKGGARCSARPEIAPVDRHIGPTISKILDMREGELADHLVVEDLAIPSPLRRLFEEVITTGAAFHDLQDADCGVHRPETGLRDPVAVDEDRIDQSLVLATMGHDQSGGTLVFQRPTDTDIDPTATAAGPDDPLRIDRCATVKWPDLHSKAQPPFDKHVKRLERLLKLDPDAPAPRPDPLARRLLPNPMWRPLPDKMDHLVEGRRGALLTVHPLGGCAMAEDAGRGVVDEYGRVFRGNDSSGPPVHEGLFVLDGSIVPTSLGINPALTITALALRAVERLIEEKRWKRPADESLVPLERPRFIEVDPGRASVIVPTHVQVVERLSGAMSFDGGPPGSKRFVQLTLHFTHLPISDLWETMGRDLVVENGTLRVFDADKWNAFRELGDHEAAFVGRVSGRLRLLDREARHPLCRVVRAFPAWLLNRGLRDAWQGIGAPRGETVWTLLADAVRLSTRAGECRRFDYELDVDADIAEQPSPLSPVAESLCRQIAIGRRRISGHKRVTYARRSNPWNQLTEMTLSEFCGLPHATRGDHDGPVILKLDMPFLARAGLPLLRITSQQSQPDALVDLASLGLYLFRLLLNLHVWSARKPDRPAQRRLERLPGTVPRLPQPEFRWFDIDDVVTDFIDWDPAGFPRPRIRLTRYAKHGGQPVLLVHGYSACGNTFAHPAVDPNLAQTLYEAGFDVWIVDLRSSIGIDDTSGYAWRFEHMAYGDLPKAIDVIADVTGKRVDVVAHCMGAAMLSMLVLKPGTSPSQVARLRRIVFLQVAPTMVFSPQNILRGYLMRYLHFYIGMQRYSTTVEANQGLTDQLLDRLLATLPYPVEDFDVENPLFWKKAPFVGTRHRLDALFGRTFNIRNMSPAVLDRIDDFFGAISTETIAQTIPFSQANVVTTHDGVNAYVSGTRLSARLRDIRVLHLVGGENGLMDPETSLRFANQLRYAGLLDEHHDTRVVEGLGHQDSLIGTKAVRLFAEIVQFLERPETGGL